MSGSQNFDGSSMIPVTTLIMQCDVCRKEGSDIAGKTEFVTGKKKFKRESLIIIKVGNMKNVSIWYQQKPIPQLILVHFLSPVNHLQV